MRSTATGASPRAADDAGLRELLVEREAIKRLNVALELQYRSVLQYSIAAASLNGIQALEQML